MAQVTVMIDGKAYRMACEEGQEDHLTELAARFDQYVNHLKSQFGEIGDLRLTVMAGIMVTDELSEVNRRLKALETDVAELRKVRETFASEQEQTEAMLAGALTEVTSQLNGIAARLNGRPAPARH